MMDANINRTRSVKEVVECYHNLLSKNLILTDNFYKTLSSYSVFSDHLIGDIKAAPPAARTEKLIELLRTRTPTAFAKFLDVLEVTGHHFLSDCLREAESYSDQSSGVDVRDMEKRLPFIQKSLKTEEHRQALEQYFVELIQKEVVKQTWKGDIQTKEQLIFSRQKQIEQRWQFEEKSKIRDKSIQELQESYFTLQEHADDLRRECKSLHKHISDLNKKHMEEIKSQIDFNMASDRHLTRLNEKAEGADGVLIDLHTQLQDVMGVEYYQKQAVHEYHNLMANFQRLCAKYRELSRLVDRFQEERQYLSNQVSGFAIPNSQDLKPHFQQYLMKHEEELNKLKARIEALNADSQRNSSKLRELEWLREKLESGDSQSDQHSAKLALLKKESEENRHRLTDKDDQILNLQKQVRSLTDKLSALEKALSHSKQNEKQIKEALQAAAESAARAELAADQSSEQQDGGETPNEAEDEQQNQPGPPPPTQHQSKTRGRPVVKAESRHSYLLKKQAGAAPIYVMDAQTDGAEAEEHRGSLSLNRGSLTESINFAQPSAQPKKSTAAGTATNYSKRLAASKAIKQAKAYASGSPGAAGSTLNSLIKGK